MRATLIRTGSSPVHASLVPGSPKVSFSGSGKDFVNSSVFSGENKKKSSPSPPPPPHLEIKDKRTIRRAMSEADVSCPLNKNSGRFSKLSGPGSRSFPANILEEEEEEEEVEEEICYGDVDDCGMSWNVFVREKSNFAGGKGMKVGGDGGSTDQKKIGDYYQKMLKSNPGDPLLLRNYGQFLHQVEKDAVRAEEYYGRAILASPGDGEVLSLYGKLIWETQRNEDRANAYFEQAVQASSNDCFVMGSYAHFLWDAEEDDNGEEVGAAALVEAF
ncbi:uncharacterized protein LOC122077220 [Macadamia integrifolia]|uniref:uncharacterized protein LOC122077220 n=1 Tax=Macadamia integrifolia TaxID=60698 RepID=UPI001C4F96E6|nr:uncharacterized protein LOC122077220 [Macadamia integrifolia]